jgi:hypothetical protein
LPRTLTISSFSLAAIKKLSNSKMNAQKLTKKLSSRLELFIILRKLENEVDGKKWQPYKKYQDTPPARTHNVYTGSFIPFYILMHPNSRTDNYNARDYRWQKQRY